MAVNISSHYMQVLRSFFVLLSLKFSLLLATVIGSRYFTTYLLILYNFYYGIHQMLISQVRFTFEYIPLINFMHTIISTLKSLFIII